VQGPLERQQLALGCVACTGERSTGERDVELPAGVGRGGRHALEQRIGLGGCGQSGGVMAQQADEKIPFARTPRLPQRGGRVAALEGVRHLAAVPGGARGRVVQTQAPGSLVGGSLPQGQKPGHARRGFVEQHGQRLPPAVQVAVEAARRHIPQAAEVVERGLVGAAAVAPRKVGHLQKASLAGQRQHGPPAGQLQPRLGRDRRLGGQAIGPKLSHAPAQQQTGHIGRMAAEGVTGASADEPFQAAHQPARRTRALVHQFGERALALRRQRSVQQGLDAHLARRGPRIGGRQVGRQGAARSGAGCHDVVQGMA